MKSPNNTGGLAAEATERRTEAKENAIQQRTRRAQNRESVSQALDRVRHAAVIGCVSLDTFGRSRMP